MENNTMTEQEFERELKTERLKGRYSLLGAIIGALGVIIAAVIGLYQPLKEENAKLQIENTASQSEIAELRDRISELENTIFTPDEKDNDQSNLKIKISALENENIKLEHEKKQLEEENNELRAVIESLNSDSIQIPDDATYFNGHAYKVFERSMTWLNAKTYCESLGGHLATITSQDEQNYLESIINNGKKYQYWLGATDAYVEGDWYWITGEAWVYTNWDIEQPDNGQGLGEDYLQIYNQLNPHVKGSSRYMWNDVTINNVYKNETDFFLLEYIGFICEWD